jgi:hypothetical protein
VTVVTVDLAHGAGLREPLARIAREIDASFDTMLAVPEDPRRRLIEAMRYAAIGGGKRLRPLLLVSTAEIHAVDRAAAVRAATAIEAIHVYSLIHDDLPCMDDDALRHGKPTLHRAFDEATAVLAGDSLHAMAFEIIADPVTSSARRSRWGRSSPGFRPKAGCTCAGSRATWDSRSRFRTTCSTPRATKAAPARRCARTPTAASRRS